MFFGSYFNTPPAKYSKMNQEYMGEGIWKRKKKKNVSRIMFGCGFEQTRIYQSRVCEDNKYNTCRLSLASTAVRVIPKIATCVLWNVGHKGESVAECPGKEILPCVWGLEHIISSPASLLTYFEWFWLTEHQTGVGFQAFEKWILKI